MEGVVVKPAPRWWRKTGEWIRSGFGGGHGSLRIGLALGGGFARGIAHIGVLRVLEQNNIPIGAIAGVSSGAIVAAAAASGATADDIEKIALSMKFRDVARWTLNLQGLAGNDRMSAFLSRLLKDSRFEDMKIPLAIVATDLVRGKPVTFHSKGDVVFPIRASCAYPGLFLPLRHQGRLLVDGFVSMEVPAEVLPQLGANYVISIAIPNNDGLEDYGNMFSVVSRCFQVMSSRNEHTWRRFSNVVIAPPVGNMTWDSFASAKKLIALGEQAARAALPQIMAVVRARGAAASPDADTVPVTA
ncbi:MAG TPA: patatin-like phospholipase family protein [Bryobacteraceae bacterium]